MKRYDSKEPRFSGSVPISTYYEYFRSGGGLFFCVLFVIVSIVTQVFLNASDYWLSIFTSNQERTISIQSLPQSNSSNSTISSWWGDNLDVYTGIYVYAIIISCLIGLSFLRTFHFFVICTRSSKKLHTKMIKAVISAPISFFEQNSIGI